MNNAVLEMQTALCEAAAKTEMPMSQSFDFVVDWFSFIENHFQT